MQKQFSEILPSTKIESVCQENLDNDLYLPQKFRIIQDYFEESTQQPDEVYSLKINEILRTNFPILFFGSKGQGKTTLALKIEELITKEKQRKQIKTLFISASNQIQSDFKSIVKQKYFSNNQQMKKFEENIKKDQIRVVIIIDDFDVILLEKQELLQNIQESIWKLKCKFIYLVNESIRKHEVYHNWVQLENGLSQYEIMQFKKMDLQKYFEQYIPYKQYLLNIDLSQQINNNLIQTIVQKIQNNQNIHNILIKIIKLSSIVDDMEQEAGNAMMILKELRVIIKNKDFSFIRMKNSSFDFVSFHKCNFEGSKMENVDISRCWFISCNLNYVLWKNMIKNKMQFNIDFFKSKKIMSIGFTNDDQVLAVGFDNLRIELWHIKACKRIAIIINDKKSNNYYSVFLRTTFSFNGMLFVSNFQEKQIKLQSCQTRKIIRKINLQLFDYLIQPIIFSHNNQILAFGFCEVIYLWDIKRGKEFLQFKEHKDYIIELQFSNDDQTLAACDGREVCIWNIKQKKLNFKQIKDRQSLTNSFSPDLKYFASPGFYGEGIIVSSLIPKAEISKDWRNELLQYGAKITDILFSPTVKYIACRLSGGAITLLSLIEKQVDQPKPNTSYSSKPASFDIVATKGCNQPMIINRQKMNPIISLKFSNNESYLISGNSGGKIQFQDLQDNSQLQLNETKFHCLAFSRSGKILAFCSQKKEKVFIFDMESGKLLAELAPESQNKECFRSITFSYDEQLLAYCYDDRIMLWNFKTRELISIIRQNKFIQAIFSPTELVLVSYSHHDHNTDDRIFIWNIPIQKQAAVKSQQQISTGNIIYQLSYSPCGNLLGQAGGRMVCIWDIKSEQSSKIFEVNEEEGNFVTIAFSPDGKVLASGGRGQIALWNIKSGNKILCFLKSSNYIKFSPNGQLLASAMGNSTIKIWDITILSVSQAPIVLTDQSVKKNKLDFSQDGTMLATCYRDGQIIIWDIHIENIDKVQSLTRNNMLQNNYSITPLYAFTNDFDLKTSNSSIKAAQINSNKGVNLTKLFLQVGGKS